MLILLKLSYSICREPGKCDIYRRKRCFFQGTPNAFKYRLFLFGVIRTNCLLMVARLRDFLHVFHVVHCLPTQTCILKSIRQTGAATQIAQCKLGEHDFEGKCLAKFVLLASKCTHTRWIQQQFRAGFLRQVGASQARCRGLHGDGSAETSSTPARLWRISGRPCLYSLFILRCVH